MRARTIRIFLTFTLAALGMLAIDASPAAASFVDCPNNVFCLWEHTDGQGHRFELRSQDANLHDNPCYNCKSSKHPGSDDTWGDQASSYFNNMNYEAYCLYANTGLTGTPLLRLNPQTLGNLTGNLNDEVSAAGPC